MTIYQGTLLFRLIIFKILIISISLHFSRWNVEMPDADMNTWNTANLRCDLTQCNKPTETASVSPLIVDFSSKHYSRTATYTKNTWHPIDWCHPSWSQQVLVKVMWEKKPLFSIISYYTKLLTSLFKFHKGAAYVKSCWLLCKSVTLMILHRRCLHITIWLSLLYVKVLEHVTILLINYLYSMIHAQSFAASYQSIPGSHIKLYEKKKLLPRSN